MESLIEHPAIMTHASLPQEVRAELSGRLEAWMRDTGVPLLDGDVEPPPGAEITDPDLVSPADAPIAHR